MPDYPPFIFHDPVEARQMENFANNAARADLAKQENLYRMAELGLRKQQQQETAELNRLITASQLQQQGLANQFRQQELTQRGELERARNENYLAGLRIQFPQGREDPRLAIQKSKEEFELEQQKKENVRDNALSTEWQTLDSEIKNLQAELDKPLPSTGFLGLSRGDYNLRRKQNEKTQADIGIKRQRQQLIEAILAERGKVPSRLGSFGIPPSASSLNGLGGQTSMDDVKREAAAAIQRGANPAEVYKRMAELGFDIR